MVTVLFIVCCAVALAMLGVFRYAITALESIPRAQDFVRDDRACYTLIIVVLFALAGVNRIVSYPAELPDFDVVLESVFIAISITFAVLEMLYARGQYTPPPAESVRQLFHFR